MKTPTFMICGVLFAITLNVCMDDPDSRSPREWKALLEKRIECARGTDFDFPQLVDLYESRIKTDFPDDYSLWIVLNLYKRAMARSIQARIAAGEIGTMLLKPYTQWAHRVLNTWFDEQTPKMC